MPRATTDNYLLASLSRADLDRLTPDLEEVDLPLRYRFAQRNRRVDHVYFIDSGLASIVVEGGKDPIEVGVIGREGVSSVDVLLGSERSPNDTFMQVAGKGRRIRSDVLRKADEESVTLHRALMRYVNALIIQISKTAQANGNSSIDERLARWLLMAHDRLDSDDLGITHEFLSLMLGTPRPGVTTAVGRLAAEGLIKTGRGHLTVLNRAGLEEKARGIYLPLTEA